MRLVKTSTWTPKTDKDKYLRDINTDLRNVMIFSEGRIRFGDGDNGHRGENISGEFHIFTSLGTATAENTISHGLDSVPIGYIVINQNKSASLYSGTTSWTNENVYFISSSTLTSFTIFLLK
jgi:hypothetical protein